MVKKRKIIYILLTFLFCLFLMYQFVLKKYYPISYFLENPSVIKNLFIWDSYDDSQKKSLLLEGIEEELKKNENINPEEKRNLLTNYQNYLEEYVKYYQGKDYLNTLLATRYIKVSTGQFEKSELIAMLGEYNNQTKEIKIENINTLFHEKIHADRSWGFENLKSNQFYEEIYSSFISKDHSYDDLKSAISLIGELIGKEKVEKSLFSKNYTLIWQTLKTTFPAKEDEIKKLEELLLEIYELEYRTSSNALDQINVQKTSFLAIYENLYQEKYQTKTEEDIIITFLKYSFLNKNPFPNINSINYKSFKIDESHEISLTNRKGSFEETLINYIIENKENHTKYSYELWHTLTNIKDKSTNKYQTFLNMYTPYFTQSEIDELFSQILFATEKDYQYIAKYTLQKRNWRIENNDFL